MSNVRADEILHLDGVVAGFGNQIVLKDLSISIRRGETIAIIGESGCGKTVTLKLLSGLLQPLKGVVGFEGSDLSKMGLNRVIAMRQKMGFLFQGAALFDSMSVYENVAYPLRKIALRSEAEIRPIVFERLKEVGLPESVASKLPAELSGGMRKRVGLARALALDPEVMFYDEPTTGLDPVMTEMINDLILQTRQRRPITSIVVTHEMKTVKKVANRVAMLYPASKLIANESQIIYNGDVEGLAQSTDERVLKFIA